MADLNRAIMQALANPQYRSDSELNDTIARYAAAGWAPNSNDLREDGTQKGMGYFGVLPRPSGGISSELSIGTDFGKGEIKLPALVPTLNTDEVNFLLTNPASTPIPRPILDKAVQFAIERMKGGNNTFAGNNEIPYGIKLAGEGKSPEWQAQQYLDSKAASAAGLPAFMGTTQEAPARLRLKDAIDRLKSTGIQIPHFIGSPNEPLGDRGATMDIENLVNGLKALEAQAVAVGDRDALSQISKERAYWENEAKQGMTAEEWKSQTGENDPIYPQ